MEIIYVDISRRDSYYWNKLFLNATKIIGKYCNIVAILKTCKQFVKKACKDIDSTEKITLFNDSVKYFETHDSFELDNFTSEIFNEKITSTDFKNT